MFIRLTSPVTYKRVNVPTLCLYLEVWFVSPSVINGVMCMWNKAERFDSQDSRYPLCLAKQWKVLLVIFNKGKIFLSLIK